MRIGGSLRQIVLVILTAIAALTVGQWLRQTVDRANATPAPAATTSPTPSPAGSLAP